MGGPHTLREQLQDAGIPVDRFSETELNALVDGIGAENNQFRYFVYELQTKGGGLTGLPQVVRFDTSKGTLLRAEIKLKNDDPCCGSPEEIDFVDDHLLLTFNVNPSAALVVVLNSNFKVEQTLGGFGMDRIAPNQVVFTGSMVHFAPTHAERLEYADLRNGRVSELYPSGNDPFRAKFVDEHSKRMPSEDVCKQLEEAGTDPCAPDMFDEGITFLGSDGNGQFALAVDRDASHAPAKDKDPVLVLSESVLYLYAHRAKGWVYCEQAISENEAEEYANARETLYASIKSRCVPSLPVVPDSSASGLGHSVRPSHHAK